jgi:hypothetical protein
MLRSDRVYLALTLVTTAALGCGGGGGTTGTGGAGGQGGGTSSVSATSSATSTGDTTSSTSTGAPMCMPGEGTAFAGTKLIFGEGNSGQWKKVGFDLDGLTSTGLSTDVCMTNSGGMPGTAYPDGDNGIDNSFGKNLLPSILSLDPTWVSDINNGIKQGLFDILLKLLCLPPTGDVPVLTTKLFGGTTLGSMPKLDGTDKWPVAPELLADLKDPESSTIIFAKSSVIGSTFDSGNNETFIVTVPVSSLTMSTAIKLTLYHAHLKMNLSADRKSATGGVIGGVLNTEEFVTEVKKIGYTLGYCDNPLFAGLLTQIRQASDILSDGTQDPSKTCDGISMGLGFEMTEALLGAVGPATPIGDSCP